MNGSLGSYCRYKRFLSCLGCSRRSCTKQFFFFILHISLYISETVSSIGTCWRRSRRTWRSWARSAVSSLSSSASGPSSPSYSWLPAPAHLARFVLPSLSPASASGPSSPLYSWLPAPAQLTRLVLPSLSPASGRPHLCTRGCWHLLNWQGWSSLPSPQPRGVLIFVLVAAGTCSIGKVGPPFPLPSLRASSSLFWSLLAPVQLARLVLPSLSPPRDLLIFVLVAASTRSLGKVCPPFPLPTLGASSPLYSWLLAPAHLAMFVLPSLSPATGRPHLCTHGCWHPLNWQGWSSLPSPQPRGVLTFVLMASATRSIGKVGPPFPFPRLGISSPLYSWLSAPADLARLVLPSLSPASGSPQLCTRGCRHPLTWQGWSSFPSHQLRGVLTFGLVAACTCFVSALIEFKYKSF